MRHMMITSLLGLFGCVDPGSLVNREQPHVDIGNGGSVHGSNRMVIYADETVVFSNWDPTNGNDQTVVTDLPAGTYEKMRGVALAQMSTYEQPDGVLCVDYGTDYITVVDAPDDQQTMADGCPNTDMRAAQEAVRQVYRDAVEGVSE
ncbi:hypothetical protein [Yoonia sp. BS5-3]|uniref:Lipoprotein n=1 Tax=Yoonia phaeophyticola TaxID=3137369 RepID=A0ABZ2V0X7_9RHOB